MTTQGDFWQKIGPTSEVGTTLRRFLPTPYGLSGNQGQGDGEFGKAIRNLPPGPLTSFAAVSPAKTSATPESVQDSTATEAVYSLRPFAWLSYSDQDGFCWRTWQRCLIEDWTRYSGRLPRSGFMQNGIVYKLPTLARRISGTGCLSSLGMWPTPKSWDGEMGFPRTSGRPIEKVTHLGTAAKYWCTPTAKDGNRGNKPARPHDTGVPLSQQVRYPTPTASTIDLGTMEMQRHSGQQRKKGKPEAQYQQANSGQLNPQWVEWLMGFPPGWTDLEDSATQ